MDLYTGKQYDALIQQTFPYGLFAFFLNSKHHISSPSNAIVIAASLFRGVDGTCEVTAKSLMHEDPQDLETGEVGHLK